jgi:hypothetical protein
MVRRTALLIAFWFGLPGCPGAPDGPDDAGADAAVPSSGLIITWVAAPSLPGEAAEHLDIAAATFQLRNVRALGDAAPGDARTSRSALELSWADGRGPGPLVFGAAPPGLYSHLELELGGGNADEAYWLRGEREEDDEEGEDEELRWEIRDQGTLAVTVPLDVTVAVGEVEHVVIGIDVGDLVRRVDWSQVAVQNGVQLVDDTSAQIDALRARVAAGVFAMQR